MTPTTCTSSRIRELNDAFRTSGFASGQWMLSRGVADMGAAFVAEAVRLVRQFDAFAEGDDPYGEHDFGAIRVGGQRLFWKIDYYDPSLSCGSDAPEDALVTRRILIIMLASEY